MKTEREIRDHYEDQIAKADNMMEAAMIKGEMNLKIKKLKEGNEVVAERPSDSDYECFGCGA